MQKQEEEKRDSTDALIKMMEGSASAEATKKAEKEYPKKIMKIKYTPTEKALVEMLTESTGVNIMDSGVDSGRAWQRNRNIKDFNKVPEIDVETNPERKEVIITRDLYGYLKRQLEVTPESKKLNKELQKIIKKEGEDKYLTEIMAEFAKANNEEGDYQGSTNVENSYNNENTLSQVIQYSIFKKEGKDYIILQIHNGADVRGGYTDPQVFELIEGWDSFIIGQSDIYAQAGDHAWSSDDSGYHWYSDTSEDRKEEGNEIPKSWDIKKDGVYYKGEKIQFN